MRSLDSSHGRKKDHHQWIFGDGRKENPLQKVMVEFRQGCKLTTIDYNQF
jgi:hypothetical protein